LEELRVTIDKAQPKASIGVGFAALATEDTLEQLMARADKALYEVKQTRHPRSPDESLVQMDRR